MQIEIEFEVYIAWDSHGNEQYAVCGESCDTIQISGLKNAAGEGIYFESDAYHLPTWADEHGVKWASFTRRSTAIIGNDGPSIDGVKTKSTNWEPEPCETESQRSAATSRTGRARIA